MAFIPLKNTVEHISSDPIKNHVANASTASIPFLETWKENLERGIALSRYKLVLMIDELHVVTKELERRSK